MILVLGNSDAAQVKPKQSSQGDPSVHKPYFHFTERKPVAVTSEQRRLPISGGRIEVGPVEGPVPVYHAHQARIT